MSKIYSKKSSKSRELKPKKEVISFLLNYSKALTILKIGLFNFEIISN